MKNEILIQRLKEGQEDAYVYLMDKYYNKLCVYATTLTKDRDKSEDIVQNILLRIWSQRDTLSTVLSLNNFLYKSVYNEFVDRYRESTRLTRLEENHIAHLDTIIQDYDFDESERLIEIVKKEIENLPPKCKSVFIMGKIEGLTYPEIAEYQNISVKTVEKQMSKAFQIIRKKLGDKVNSVLVIFFGYQLD